MTWNTTLHIPPTNRRVACCILGDHLVILVKIDGLLQDYSNPSALGMGLLQSCTKPSKCELMIWSSLALVVCESHSWYLPCCQCTEACYHISFIQDNIYIPVPCVSTSMEHCSCLESTRCCSQLVPIRFWRMGHGLVVRTLATTVGGEGCLSDFGVLDSPLASTSWSNSLIFDCQCTEACYHTN